MSFFKIIVRVGMALVVLISLHYYLWFRLVKNPGWPDRVQKPLLLAFIVATSLIPIALFLGWYTSNFWGRSVAFAGYTWLGTMFLLLVATLASEFLRVTGMAIDPQRRQILSKGLSLSIATLGLSGATLGMRRALREIEVKRVDIELTKLPHELDGLVIVQITDTHIGPTIRGEFIKEVVDKTNAENPDLVVLTGDLVDGSVENLREHTAPFGHLKSKYGTYFVTGNHEYYSGADAWIAEFQRLGIRVLRNERVAVKKEGAQIDLAGVDDWSAHNFGGDHGADLDKALAERAPNIPCVLLAHNPMAGTAAINAKVDLMLSGHTHGGQIWPFNNVVWLVNKWVVGHYIEGDTQIYVSPGTGYWGPPMRLFTSAEVSKIVLHSPKTGKTA